MTFPSQASWSFRFDDRVVSPLEKEALRNAVHSFTPLLEIDDGFVGQTTTGMTHRFSIEKTHLPRSERLFKLARPDTHTVLTVLQLLLNFNRSWGAHKRERAECPPATREREGCSMSAIVGWITRSRITHSSANPCFVSCKFTTRHVWRVWLVRSELVPTSHPRHEHDTSATAARYPG
jgi:hypothetical protein